MTAGRTVTAMAAGERSASRLVLFTASYPTGAGETFLADELPWLAAAFDPVVVVPSRLEATRRAVPPGIAVDERWAAVYRRIVPERWADAAAGLRTPAWWADVVGRLPVTAHKVSLRSAMLYARRARALAAWLPAALPPAPGPTLYYSYWLGPLTYGLGRARRRLGPAAIVSRAHGGDVLEDRYRPPYLPLRAATIAAADGIFPVSDAGRAALLRRAPAAAGRIVTHRLGVPDPGLDAAPSADGGLRIVTCGGCRPVKRLDVAVAAIAALAAAEPGRPIAWDHFGDGPTRPAVEALANASLGPNVAWTLHGHVEGAQIAAHYAARPVDVCLNTSASEGVSVALMEAQSYGVPCVATAVGGTPEIVDDGNGRLVAADASAAAIAAALAAFRPGTPAAAARAAAKASWRARYRAEANYPAFAEALRATLDEAVARRGSPARPGDAGAAR